MYDSTVRFSSRQTFSGLPNETEIRLRQMYYWLACDFTIWTDGRTDRLDLSLYNNSKANFTNIIKGVKTPYAD